VTGPSYRAGRMMMSAANAVPFVAPHAALLIDFDNVTMGVRSDLTKELKALLNSDIIKGKVTVQRAYADWRRYPQYVMPLTERSIDMIWATAVGSTKKNATDIRLAIDAIELVFTRPEIGTFIILSGDSDFSSLVLKLKEYGKYVVGIGIRESASDLLIQNCDEYYSYSELAGLNKEVDTPSVQRDPWDLVREAVQRMVTNGDVMRSDRLKQVMQQIDQNFDERNAGFNRFSKFVAEAANRGLVTLTKLDNGQFEVSIGAGAAPAARPAPMARPTSRGTPRSTPATVAAAAPEPTRSEDEERRRGRGRRGGRDRDRGRRDAAPTERAAPSERVAPTTSDRLSLSGAFELLKRALGELPSSSRHDVVRARMAALHGREDQLLDAERFGRLLRQANDAEIADVKKTGEDEYEVSLSRVERARMSVNGSGHSAPAPVSATAQASVTADRANERHAPPESAPEAAGSQATLRFRRGSRSPIRNVAIPLVGMVTFDDVKHPPAAPVVVPVEAVAPKAKPSRPSRARGKKAATPAAAAAEPVLAAVSAPVGQPAVAAARGRPRRPRGRGKGKPS
jgi:uncharacterized protein (TIGR00288 family)